MAIVTDLAEQIARLAQEKELRVGVAESLTGGAVCSALAKAPGAQKWLAGGLVAYQVATKRRLLGVESGVDPCSAACASQMASGVQALLGADIAVAITGVGGPDAEDGHEPGTVYVAVATEHETHWWQRSFSGSPAEIVEQSVRDALEQLHGALDSVPTPRGT